MAESVKSHGGGYVGRLQKELEHAKEHQRRMKEEHRQLIHSVATSPVKKKHVSDGNNGADDDKNRKNEVVTGEQQEHAAAVVHIPAYRPVDGEAEKYAPSPDQSQDTFGREVDAAVARHVHDVVMHHRGETHGVASHEVYQASPLFLTTKRKAMHCELDEPGSDIPFPKNSQKKNVFQRILSCFHTPSVYSPPRVTSPRPRPSSAGLVPPMLTLEKEVAPLKTSLCGDSMTELEDPMYDSVQCAVRRTEEQPVCLDILRRQESFESLVAEVSDAEDLSPDRGTVVRQAVSVVPQPHSVAVSKKSTIAVQDLVYTNKKIMSMSTTKEQDVDVDVVSSSCRGNTTKVGTKTAASPMKPPRHAPRMTKAALARNAANKKKMEERKMMESAHWEAMPTAVKKAESSLRVVPRTRLQESLNSLPSFDDAKRSSIESAAMWLFSQKSFDFSEDPFYRELAKIDTSLTPDDLDRLRQALVASSMTNQ